MSMTADRWLADAARLDALAERARAALDPVAARHGPMVWQGVRAVRFGRELALRRVALHHAADQLAAEAHLLRARAALARAAGA